MSIWDPRIHFSSFSAVTAASSQFTSSSFVVATCFFLGCHVVFAGLEFSSSNARFLKSTSLFSFGLLLPFDRCLNSSTFSQIVREVLNFDEGLRSLCPFPEFNYANLRLFEIHKL